MGYLSAHHQFDLALRASGQMGWMVYFAQDPGLVGLVDRPFATTRQLFDEAHGPSITQVHDSAFLHVLLRRKLNFQIAFECCRPCKRLRHILSDGSAWGLEWPRRTTCDWNDTRGS